MKRGPSLLVVTLAIAAACKRDGRDRERAAAELPPLAAASPTIALAVEGFGDAVAVLPVGATRSMPVVVAVLGLGDSAEEQCAAWGEVVGGRAFVLCPRGAKYMVQEESEGEAGSGAGPNGSADSDLNATGSPEEEEKEKPSVRLDKGRLRQMGYYPVDAATLDREVNAALAALAARHGAHVSDREVVYAGFSRGAFLGASLAAKHPARFTRLVLIEGGHDPWRVETAALFARGGGKRVLFACGQQSCVDEAAPAAALLEKEKVANRVVHGEGEGHGYKKQVKEELRRSLDWVTEGDPAWRRSQAR